MSRSTFTLVLQDLHEPVSALLAGEPHQLAQQAPGVTYLRLLESLEALARESGVRVLRLETNHALGEAIELYRGAGFAEVAPFNDEPYTHHWFEKVLS